ncbi:MAG TPA: DUF1993 domain-containing protein [Candidatus Acidoferrum sp.]|nr:DUF1993 domain-containing protein [Candidatus Acidoferrum sp.]
MSAQSILQFKKMLTNIDNCMAKAEALAAAKKFDVNVLANYRLAPDMYPLIRQVQSFCDTAKFAAAYLSKQTPPKHEDNETTFAELRARIGKVVSYLDGFKAADFAGYASVKVAPGWAQGKWLTGEEYLEEIAVPNFYFHVMIAYAILRHAGVDVGKMDYMGSINLKD